MKIIGKLHFDFRDINSYIQYGFVFINEPQPVVRTENQKQTDKMIEDKLGSSNLMTKIIAWLTGTIIGPVISFKKNGFNIAIAILGFVFLLK